MNNQAVKFHSSAGNPVPSVTQVLGVSSKPYLVPWANDLGLKGLKYSDYMERITTIGSIVHERIEAYVLNLPFDDTKYSVELLDESEPVFNKFIRWETGNSMGIMETETPMESNIYGGIMDAVVDLNGKPTLMDWKTSKEIYSEYFSQLAAYHRLLSIGWVVKGFVPESEYEKTNNKMKTLGNEIKQVAILNVPKESGEATLKIMETTSPEFRDHINFFDSCLSLYHARKKIK